MRIIKCSLLILLLNTGCLFSQNEFEGYTDSLSKWGLKHPDYLKTAKEFYSLANEKGEEEYLAGSNYFLASYYLYKVKYDSARYYLFEGLNYKSSFKGRQNLCIGLSYSWQENYVLGFYYLQRSVPYLKDQPQRLAKAYNNMAICLKVQKDNEGSRVYYRLAKQIQYELGSVSNEANATLNLALSFNSDKKYDSDSVVLYLNEALVLSKKAKNNLSLSGVYSAFAGHHNKMDDHDTALKYVDSAKFFCKLLTNREYRMAGILIYEATAYLGNSDFVSFERALNELEVLLPRVESEEIKSHYLLNRHFFAKHQGNYKEALEFYKASIAISDSLYNGQKLAEITNMKYSLELSDKEKEKISLELQAESLEKGKIKSDTELASKSKELIVAVVVLSLLVIIILLIYNLYRKNKVQMILAEKNERLAQERVAQKELLIAEIHHRIKNNLQLISSMLFIEASQSENLDVQKSLETSSKRLQSIGELHKSLYSKDSYTTVDMKEYVSDLADSVGSSYSPLEVEHEIEVESVLIDVDSAITLGLILNELITNAYKYAFQINARNTLKFQSKVRNGVLQIQLEDSGSTPIESSNSSSFGFKLIRTLVKQMKGTISFDFQEGNRVNIEIRKLKLQNER